MLMSVITVCFNAENEIGKTIASVLEQDADFFEYLIIDGASTDRTMEIVDSFRPTFEAKGIPMIVASEKDTGIYNAMNKGARLASGEWLIYMNAGDRFHSASTLAKLRGPLMDSSAPFVYGGTVYVNGEKIRIAPPRPMDIISRWMPFCHQSIFIRATLMRQRPYDERYRICADYDFFVWAYKHGYAFQPVHEFVSLFQFGGISTTRSLECRFEKARIQRAYGIITLKRYLKLIILLGLEQTNRLFLTEAEKRRLDTQYKVSDKKWIDREPGMY